MNTCETCRWWGVDKDNAHCGITEPWDVETGLPMEMPFKVKACGSPSLLFCERPVERNQAAVADASTYCAKLYTGPDFGCTRHVASGDWSR